MEIIPTQYMAQSEESVTDSFVNFSNSTLGDEEEYIAAHGNLSYIFNLFNVVASGFGMPGNFLVVVVIAFSPNLRGKIFNKFILNQSILDCGVCTCLFFDQVH